eukprot:COSAG02_NODE_18272_length_949_cov_1.258824_1_plen_54_part_00
MIVSLCLAVIPFEVEFEVFKMLHSMVDEVASVQEEPESLEGVVLTEGHTGVWA